MRRALWLILPIVFILMIGIAHALEPSPQGLGTHRALGLPPCLFWFLTGIPCPSCGLTTSICHLVHLNFIAAFHSHPLGLLCFALFALLSGLSLLEFFEFKTPLQKFLQGHDTGLVYFALVLYLGTWGVRILL